MLTTLRSILINKTSFCEIRKLCKSVVNISAYQYHIFQRLPLRRRISSERKQNGRHGTVFVLRGFSTGDLPEHFIIKLPALSPTMEMGKLSSWLKNEGDEVKEGDVLAEVETDKATMAVESSEAGYLAKILIQAGSADVAVGTPICVIAIEQKDIAVFKNYAAEKMSAKPVPPTPDAAPQPPVQAPPAAKPPIEAPRSEPRKKLEKEQKTGQPTPKTTPASKPGKADGVVEAGRQRPAVPERSQTRTKPSETASRGHGKESKNEFTDHPLTSIRKTIADRLTLSYTTIPHFYLTIAIMTKELETIRKILNTELGFSGVKLSLNDFVLKAAALTCKEVPASNASWMGTHIREYSGVDVSVAVSTPQGLITPVVYNAHVLSIREISQQVKSLAKKARQGKLTPQEYQGGTFTVSNLGMFGVNEFYGIINPPQSCILCVGTQSEATFLKDDSKITTLGSMKYMNVTLGCDHRVIDGAVAAQWTQTFRHFMENPKTLF